MIAGVGADITEIARVERALRRTPRLAETVFTQAEAAYCRSKARPGQSFAVCFAAKEAAFKALRLQDEHPRWQEIELVHDSCGLPSLILHGQTAALAAERGVERWHISCSHSDTQALAFVIAEAANDDYKGDMAP